LLQKIAIQTMIERGFIPRFSREILDEASQIKQAVLQPEGSLIRDLRDKLWVSIDNEDSRDLDQLTFAEADRIFIAIADVDSLLKKGSKIDQFASHNTTSVYTPSQVFPMLPPLLSNDWTSLNENEERCAIVVSLRVSEEGSFGLEEIFQGFVRNHGKLTYDDVSCCLLQQKCSLKIEAFRKQLELQDFLAQKILRFREEKGALAFAEIKVSPVVQNGVATHLKEKTRNRADQLIENFMIAANVGVTHYLNTQNKPSLRRIVRTPKRWDRIVSIAKDLGENLPIDPDAKALSLFLQKQQTQDPSRFPDLSLSIIKLIGRGEYVLGMPGQKDLEHFDLAQEEYTHATAPNRRFTDLVMQRLVKSCMGQEISPYTNEELAQIADHCTKKETDALKVERKLEKCFIAMVMKKEIGKSFKAIVTGAATKGTWVRIFNPSIEGKLVQGFEGMDVGDYLVVKLVHVDVFNGYIDFIRVV
jgi:VacB/RNase II family 3'-5' exoribonuclease